MQPHSMIQNLKESNTKGTIKKVIVNRNKTANNMPHFIDTNDFIGYSPQQHR